MRRVFCPARDDWQKTVESQGLLFHSAGGVPYWDESAYYLFEAAGINQLEAATYQLNEMCLAAVAHVIEHRRLGDLHIPTAFHNFVTRSWDRDEHTIYGRFDLAYDGAGPPKLLEYNADTPTALLESAVIQWFWFQDLLASTDKTDRPQFDQFNSLHERLIEAWLRIRSELGKEIVFAADGNLLEDVMTTTYLRDTAIQAGLKTQFLSMSQIGWHAGRRVFTDLRERAIEILFKLYPWEWMLREPFGRNLVWAPTIWLEPPWKMVLSNKAILPILYELFPDSPYLLPTGFQPLSDTHVVKPFYSREGANITIVTDGQSIAQTDGSYADGPFVYQQFHPLPTFDGNRHSVIGSWIVNGHACGIGIREDDSLITRNTSRFLPHIFRKSPTAKPPAIDNKRLAGPADRQSADALDPANPLYDSWLDR
jgi:glutathionylspermidine synthase